MNFGKLILASCTFGPAGYFAGWIAGHIFGSLSTSLFGIGGAVIVTLLAYLFIGGGKAAASTPVVEPNEEAVHNLNGVYDVVDRDLFIDNKPHE